MVVRSGNAAEYYALNCREPLKPQPPLRLRKQKQVLWMTHGQILNVGTMGNRQGSSLAKREPSTTIMGGAKGSIPHAQGIVYSPDKYRETEGSKVVGR